MFNQFLKMMKNLKQGYADNEKREHCNDPILLSLVEEFKNKNFNKVEEMLKGFSDDYKEFGFNSLGEVNNENLFKEWVDTNSENELPKLAHAYFKIVQGSIIRGIGPVSSVDDEDMEKFHKLFLEAEEILLGLEKLSKEFEIYKYIGLLTVRKINNSEDREFIHELFKKGLAIKYNHIGLHIAYFITISEKWGGTREEIDKYFEEIPAEPELLSQCISAIYYWDLIRVYQIDDEDTENVIRKFMMDIDTSKIENNLYRYSLYLRVYWLSSMIQESLEDKYYNLVKDYWDDQV
ncbi:MAG: hypothetical protein KGV57_04750 [Fusobacterium sp.]|nr:hypothetical protein [Fusobacterium sp.]